MSFGVSIDTSGIDELMAQFPGRVEKEVLQPTAEFAEGRAADLAHFQTGAMRAGMYHSTSEGSNYEAAVAAAREANPNVVILPEVPLPPPGQVTTSNCTEESLFEELGTVAHGPHPFLGPASMEAEAVFAELCEALGASL